MNRHRQNREESMLSGVLAETATDFREALLTETLRLARQRRQQRQARTAGGILAAIILSVALAWHVGLSHERKHSPATLPSPRPLYQIVQTRPLPANVFVRTPKISSLNIITSNITVPMIATTTGGNYRSINDDELLALVAGKPAVLVRTGSNSETLVFASTERQKSPFAN